MLGTAKIASLPPSLPPVSHRRIDPNTVQKPSSFTNPIQPIPKEYHDSTAYSISPLTKTPHTNNEKRGRDSCDWAACQAPSVNFPLDPPPLWPLSYTGPPRHLPIPPPFPSLVSLLTDRTFAALLPYRLFLPTPLHRISYRATTLGQNKTMSSRRLVGLSTKMYFSLSQTRHFVDPLVELLPPPTAKDVSQVDIFLIPD
ncbi:hypothetical protein L249_6338, partial [Ophiocordyceps polyrhachis-furcata BCC 54312]